MDQNKEIYALKQREANYRQHATPVTGLQIWPKILKLIFITDQMLRYWQQRNRAKFLTDAVPSIDLKIQVGRNIPYRIGSLYEY